MLLLQREVWKISGFAGDVIGGNRGEYMKENYAAKYKNSNAAIAYTLTNTEDIETFVNALKLGLQKVKTQAPKGKQCSILVSVVVGEQPFQPLVDLAWACAALPCSYQNLRVHMQRNKHRLDPPIYRRIVQPSGFRVRHRLLSLNDLKVLRGSMLVKNKGHQMLVERGDILGGPYGKFKSENNK